MQQNPIASIIVPVYNSSSYLHSCLDSLLRQSLSEIEILLIDDGSTDNSLNICDSYASYDNRFKVINCNHLGVSEARNIGVKNAIGDYIAFVDSDDTIKPDMFLDMCNRANMQNADLVICGMEFIYNNRTEIYTYPNTDCIGQLSISNHINSLVSSFLLYPCCNKLYRSKILKDNSIYFNPEISFLEDILFNIDYIKKVQTLSVIDESYYQYYKRGKETLLNKFNYNKYRIFNLLNDSLIDVYKYFNIYNATNQHFLKNRHAWNLYSSIHDVINTKVKFRAKYKCSDLKKYFYEITNDKEFKLYIIGQLDRDFNLELLVYRLSNFSIFWIYVHLVSYIKIKKKLFQKRFIS